MSKVIKKNVAEIIIIGVFLIVFLSSCGSTKQIQEHEKGCCETTQLIVESDCENCDEID